MDQRVLNSSGSHQISEGTVPDQVYSLLLGDRSNLAAEKQIEIVLDDGVTVVGRIDLVRRTDRDEIAIVDLKSSDVAQEETMTERQLHVYALGYQELTGRDADLVEIYELDSQTRKPRSIDDHFIDEVKSEVATAASAMRLSFFPPKPSPKRCRSCDLSGLCAHRNDL